MNPFQAVPPLAKKPDYPCLEARAQALEEAVSLALFASAWLQHSQKDPRASKGARMVAHLLAACSGETIIHGPEAFAKARRFLESDSG
jgi:hypothetical protein